MPIWTTLPANGKKLVATVVVFLIYVLIAFVFAFIYTRIFKRNPTAYGFGSLSDAQRRAALKDTLQKIERCEVIHKVLALIASEMEKQSDQEISLEWRLETDAGKIVYYKQVGPHTPPITSVRLFLPGVPEPIYAWRPDVKFFIAYTTRALLEEVKRHLKDTNTQLRQLSDRKRKLEDDSSDIWSPDIWSFVDFLYFSVIIQSTVGLGDIQPNSAIVRKVVMSQIFLSYAVLIVLLNVLLNWDWSNGQAP
jgi:hypothetical protein